MAELPVRREPRRKPPRCRAIHPWIEEATALRLEAQAQIVGVAPEQLAAFILEKVIGDVALQRRVGI